MKNEYICCFCDKSIESDNIDVCSVIVITNWDKNDEQHDEQQFFCHFNCFKNKLHNNIPLYFNK